MIPGKKSLTKEEAEVILSIEFTQYYANICKKFLQFLKESKYKDINNDQWMLMLDVFEIFERKEKYDLDGACIIIFTHSSYYL